MTVVPKTNHVSASLLLLLSQFQDQPKIAALLSAFVEEIQEVEDCLAELITDRSLDNAVGAQLDGIGRILDVARGAQDDDDYRTRLRVQIAINQSSGTVEDLLSIMTLADVTSDPISIRIQRGAIAEFQIEIFGAMIKDSEAALLAEFVTKARAAAVYAYFVYLSDGFANDDPFSFGPDLDVDGFSFGFDTGAFVAAIVT